MAYEGELTSAEVKAAAKRFGADLCGIGNMERWEGAPKQNDPRYIFPGAKSFIVFGFRIPRGSLRGIEEGTLFSTYPTMGYAALNQVWGPMVMWPFCNFMEDHGYEVVPLINANGGESVNTVTGKFREGWSRPVAPGKPHPDVLVHFRIAAYLAGMGEFGWSKVFLTPEFGPRVRFVVLLTDAELEPDPIYEGHICDRCKLCVRNCAGHAISMNESVKVTLAGHEVEWGKLDEMACEHGLQGGEDKLQNPFDAEYPRQYGYGRAIEGAAGCTRACMIHLEQRGKLLKTFRNQFRAPGVKPWRIDRSKPYEIDPDLYEYYMQNAGVEPHNAMTEYNAKENYGSAAAAGLSGVPDEDAGPKVNAAGLTYNPMMD
ncbi:MAG: hypothetical protein IJ721_02805 [Bacteroidales bacterium]|nr:hypothetical protein [Bacteroidales bacterium]